MNSMLNKKINTATIFIKGILFITIGILFLTQGNHMFKLLILVLGGVSSLVGLITFILSFFKKDKTRFPIMIEGLLDSTIGILIIIFSNLILPSLGICFGIYLIGHVIISIITYYIYKKNSVKGRLIIVIQILFYIIYLIPLLFNIHKNIDVISLILGIYLIIIGITNITDFIGEIIPAPKTNKIKSQIQIPLPVLINAFIPKKLITLINELLEVEEPVQLFYKKKKNATPDLFVIIHLANSGSASMGHVEIGFEDKIYSYGNYDMHSRSLFGAVGDGIILIADKKKYLEYVITKKNRYIVEFGLTLTEIEKKEVKNQIHNLVYTNTVDYYPDLALADLGKLPKGKYQDMSSEIYLYANGKFKKIISGKHKKFFVLKSNCAMVANSILKTIGKQIFNINGIITPGAYYDYCNKRFMMKNTNVISRKIYTKRDFE